MALRAAASAPAKFQSNQNLAAASELWASAESSPSSNARVIAAFASGNAVLGATSLLIGRTMSESASPENAMANPGSRSVALRKYSVALQTSGYVLFAQWKRPRR